VGVFGKDVLRIAVRHRHRLRGGEKILFTKNQLASHNITSAEDNRALFAIFGEKR
jgi:hypothetical protein